MARKKIGELLKEAGLLDERQLHRALVEQQRWGGPLGRVLVDLGMVGEALDEHQVQRRVSSLAPAGFAEENGVIAKGVASREEILERIK